MHLWLLYDCILRFRVHDPGIDKGPAQVKYHNTPTCSSLPILFFSPVYSIEDNQREALYLLRFIGPTQ
jgi:hypothetical protein